MGEPNIRRSDSLHHRVSVNEGEFDRGNFNRDGLSISGILDHQKDYKKQKITIERERVGDLEDGKELAPPLAIRRRQLVGFEIGVRQRFKALANIKKLEKTNQYHREVAYTMRVTSSASFELSRRKSKSKSETRQLTAATIDSEFSSDKINDSRFPKRLNQKIKDEESEGYSDERNRRTSPPIPEVRSPASRGAR